MRLGEILIERKLIYAEDLERALELQKERGDKIGKTLVDMGFVAMRDVLAALARSVGRAAGGHRRPSRCFHRNRSALAAIPAPVPLSSGEPRRPHRDAGDGRSAGCRDHRGGPQLHRSEGEHGARGRAGNSGRHRQVLRRIGARGETETAADGADAIRRPGALCATWPAKRRSSAW